MSAEREQNLPSFERPPVHEVAVGIGFHRLACWDATAAGEFRALVRDRYPLTEDKPPLAPLPSTPGEELELGLADLPPIRRVWFVSEDGSTLIQVQDDRLHVNWRKTSEESAYPRYEQVLEQFRFALECLIRFAGERDEALRVRAGEVTYVNHIPEGELWHDWCDLSGVFGDWSVVPRNVGSADGVATVATFDGGDGGTGFVSANHHMNVEVKAALRSSDRSRVLILQLVNRGTINSGDFHVVSEWLGTASADIVKGFTALTSAEAHSFWGRRK
jgi:uncharacterized protein (TIGR04255 family)